MNKFSLPLKYQKTSNITDTRIIQAGSDMRKITAVREFEILSMTMMATVLSGGLSAKVFVLQVQKVFD